jgi:trk system potassium uptake protein
MVDQFSPKLGDRIFRIPRAKSLRLILPGAPKRHPVSVSLATVLYGFAAIIVAGGILLMMPFASNSGTWTSPLDAFFTSTSAVCVTGLVVVDTADHFNLIGQIIILILIQLGGLGFMTSATLFLMALGRRIGLSERILIKESLGEEFYGGLLKLVLRIVLFTFIAECIGAIILSLRFATIESVWPGIWKGIFQSISAFNNAGFDINGGFRSLLDYQSDATILITTALLIILGGIGFTVVRDVVEHRKFYKFSLNTKLVIVSTGILLGVGTLVFFVAEYSNPDTLGQMLLPQKMLNSFFHSVTPRTAGFASVDVGKMMTYSLFFTIFLMFVGGASGSTAGGIKVNTFGAITIMLRDILRGKEHPSAFGREFRISDVFRLLTIIILSIGIIFVGVSILSFTEKFAFLNILFEVVSAFGTVGLSTGITPSLSIAGKIVIIFIMFVGRLGPLTMALSLIQRRKPTLYRYPEEPIKVG